MENPTIGRKIRIFFYCVKKTLFVDYFQKYTFKVPVSSHFEKSSKVRNTTQSTMMADRWNLCKIAHVQQASTESRELAWILYSHSL